MRRQSVGGYPGICRVHRAELKRLHGRWSEAEQEARQACVELERFGLLDAVGLRPIRGGRGSAAHGRPGRGRRSLRSRIRVRTRRTARDRAAAPGPGRDGRGQTLDRTRARRDDQRRGSRRSSDAGRLLPAQIDIALAAGDLETAGPAVDELESIAADFQRPVFEAGALTGRGELLLGEDRPSEASPILGRSWRLWLDTELPYESARARLRYAEAEAADGDPVARSPGPARCSQRVRAARSKAATLRAWTRCWGRGANRRRGPTRAADPDLHVHRHRDLDRSRRADRR